MEVPSLFALFREGRLNHNAASSDKRAAIMGRTIEFVKTLKLDRREGRDGTFTILVGKIVLALRYPIRY